MLRLTLSEEDRKELGAPDELPIDLARLTTLEAIGLQKVGFKSLRALHKRLEVKSVEGDELDAEMDIPAWRALVWLALRRAGVHIDFAELDFDILGLRILGDDEAPPSEDDPGKAPAPEASKRSGPSRASRSTTSRRKSPRTS